MWLTTKLKDIAKSFGYSYTSSYYLLFVDVEDNIISFELQYINCKYKSKTSRIYGFKHIYFICA